MARTYKRDAAGRFASNGGGSRGPAKVGRAGPRGGKTGTRAEQRRNARAQQERTQSFRSKAAPTAAKAAYKAAASAARRAARGGPGNGIRPTGGLARPRPGGNAIRPGPRFGKGRSGGLNGDRQVKDAWRRLRRERVGEMRWMARTQARALADRLGGGINAEIAGITLRSLGSKLGVQQIKRRARRAARLAAAGSRPAARAAQLYDQQLAAMPPGRRSRRKAKSNIRPGPRNANPEKKPKRKRKK